jgi:D-cysteine desulfhydrase
MFPLFERFPALKRLERVELCTLPSPLQQVSLPGGPSLWIKRDDLNSDACGGNKVRSLEFLLGGLREGDVICTVGGAGSTHVLCTAIHAERIGVRLDARRWSHDMNPVADVVSERVTTIVGRAPGWSASGAMMGAVWDASRRSRRLIPIGGSTPLGVLGHVNAALELAAQIEQGEMPVPDRVVVPLGSGGTTAGLLLGFAIAGLPIVVVGARVGPRLFVNRPAVIRLARRTAKFVESITAERLPAIDPLRLRIVHHVYGGAYGRPLPAAREAANILQTVSGIRLDDTYSAKAWVAAMDEARHSGGTTLFWLTFDARCLTS